MEPFFDTSRENSGSPVWSAVLAEAKERGGLISLGDFVRIALYNPNFGYYTSERNRAGGCGADFYTAASMKRKIFSRLIRAAAIGEFSKRGLGENNFKIVEIGSERANPMFHDSAKIFLGDAIRLPDTCAVVSNELLDAQAFERFRFKGGVWKKTFLSIAKSGDKILSDIVLKPAEPKDSDFLNRFYSRARVEGFSIDSSSDAREIFKRICSIPWKGILLFFDYFRTCRELCLLPNGTGRTYKRHSQGENIAESPGETDITFSPCSDEFSEIALEAGFKNIVLETQESFIIRRAGSEAEKIISSKDPFDPDKRELAELMSPAHMGAAFRVLSAERF